MRQLIEDPVGQVMTDQVAINPDVSIDDGRDLHGAKVYQMRPIIPTRRVPTLPRGAVDKEARDLSGDVMLLGVYGTIADT